MSIYLTFILCYNEAKHRTRAAPWEKEERNEGPL